VAASYGKVSAAALDPLEKKPLYHFFPGRSVFSIGGYGCNLKCAFCQNSGISQFNPPTVDMSPEEVAAAGTAGGSLGVAYTYNEPSIAAEYVGDCALAVRKAGGLNVLVTNGFMNPEPLADLIPLIDAMNIDIKAFNNDFYRRLCGGGLEPVLETAKAAARKTHVELTTLIIPGENDAIPELADLAGWIADNCGRTTPCHLTAYHPSYKLTRAAATAAHLRNAGRIFRARLDYVYLGNLHAPDFADTVCPACGRTVIARSGFAVDASGLGESGTCAGCGADCRVITAK
jgi:pyruvate formate lyase activating enzyme